MQKEEIELKEMQKKKMKELWDNKEDEDWEEAWKIILKTNVLKLSLSC